MDRSAWGLLLLIGIALGVKLIFLPRPFRSTQGAHGTGRFCSKGELQGAGLTKPGGLLLGQCSDGTLLYLKGVVHTALYAMTGAGKGVSYAIPWIRQCIPGSCIICDPKGELYRLTSKWRKTLGQRVIRLDPFGVCGPGSSDTFNPLMLIGDGLECVGEAKALGEAIVVRTGEERDPHWNEKASSIISNVLALLLYRMRDDARNLISLRSIVSDPKLRSGSAEAMRQLGGVFADNAASIEGMSAEEAAGVFSTVGRHLDFLGIPEIAQSVAKSNFDPRGLLGGLLAGKGMTIYLILPAHFQEACARWMRLVVVSLVRMIMRLNIGKEDCPPIHFIIDEAATVLRGGIPAIDEALVLGRSFGIRLNLIFQSFSQVKETFKNKESAVLGNTTPIIWSVNDLETAERVSKMLGNRGIVTQEAHDRYGWDRDTGKPSATYKSSSEQQTKEMGRPLLYADEVLNLHPRAVIAFCKGLRPIMAWRVLWYSHPLFGGGKPWRRLGLPLWWVLMAGAAGLIVWALLN